MTTEVPLTVSVREAASILGIGRDAAYEAARTGTIPVLRFGKLYRVPRAALMEMVKSARAHESVAA